MTIGRAHRVSLLAALAGCVLLAACDSGPAYGSKQLANFTPPPASPSPSPSPSTAPPTPAPAPTHSVVVTHAPTQTPHQQAVVMVAIQNDSQAPAYFNPIQVIIPVGGAVTWVNHDSQPRGVAAQDNSWSSPSIPPGGSWTHTFAKAGDNPYGDTTRPYASGGDVQVH